jgi:hypothetical protein
MWSSSRMLPEQAFARQRRIVSARSASSFRKR